MVNKIWGFFIIGNIKLINDEILNCTKSAMT